MCAARRPIETALAALSIGEGLPPPPQTAGCHKEE
jgi:hypothetical protein